MGHDWSSIRHHRYDGPRPRLRLVPVPAGRQSDDVVCGALVIAPGEASFHCDLRATYYLVDGHDRLPMRLLCDHHARRAADAGAQAPED